MFMDFDLIEHLDFFLFFSFILIFSFYYFDECSGALAACQIRVKEEQMDFLICFTEN